MVTTKLNDATTSLNEVTDFELKSRLATVSRTTPIDCSLLPNGRSLIAELFLLTRGQGQLTAGSQRILVLWPILWPTQMRTHRDDRPGLGEILDRGNRRADTGVIRNGFPVEGNVEIASHENFFALEVGGGEVGYGFLGAHGDQVLLAERLQIF